MPSETNFILCIKSCAAAADSVSMQVSAPVRIVALVGVVAALGMAAWTFALGHKNGTSSSSSTAQAGDVAQHPIAAAKAVASKLNAHNKATAMGTHAAASQTKHATARHKGHGRRTTHATSMTIASVLRHHRVAVVLLYDPQTKIDSLSLGEAQLGAERAHAGFLRVNVLRQHQVGPFVKTYGVMQVPTVLFFARPGKLVQKLDGFADHETVAQAALNAAHGLVATQG